MWKCWEGQDITGEEIAAFKELINDELNRQVVMMCLQCYHLANRLELSEKGFGHCTKMILTLFHKVGLLLRSAWRLKTCSSCGG